MDGAATAAAPLATARSERSVGRASTARTGTTLIVEVRHGELSPLTLERGAVLDTRFGAFHHDDFIGQPVGAVWYARQTASQQRSRGGSSAKRPRGPSPLLPSSSSSPDSSHAERRYVRTLPATQPALYALSANHRTQVLYAPDAAQVVLQLELTPGAVVVESGTGSGCLTLSLARAVAPHGRVFTYDFHRERSARAADDMARLLPPHVAESVVRARHRDVVADGFGADELPDGAANAVFLDLPEPHKVIREAARALRRGTGTLMTFSPCVEQVQRALRAIDGERAFHSVSVRTVLMREWETFTMAFAPPPPPQQLGGVSHAGDCSDGDGGAGPQFSVVSRPKPSARHRGHTGYLLFARRRCAAVDTFGTGAKCEGRRRRWRQWRE